MKSSEAPVRGIFIEEATRNVPDRLALRLRRCGGPDTQDIGAGHPAE